MPNLYTIGYQGTPLSAFIGALRTAGVDVIIDVRLRNTSHLAGYTKKDTLSFLLTEGFHIGYEHIPALAPTDEILDTYREAKDWQAYEAQFLPLLEARDAPGIGRGVLAHYHSPCLLCAEPKATRCHRRLIAETWSRHLPGLIITHLEP